MSSKQRIKIYRRLDFRLTVRYSSAFLLTTFIICAFLYFRMSHSLLREIDRILYDEGREIATALLLRATLDSNELRELHREYVSRRFYTIQFRIMNPEGKELFVSKEQFFRSLPTGQEFIKALNGKKRVTETVYRPRKKYPLRVYLFPLYQRGKPVYIVQVATTMKFMHKNLNSLLVKIAQAIPLALLLGALGGWLLARGSLKPIEEVAKTARRITASNLSERIPLNYTGDELDELIRTINDMIARIEDAFRRIAQFTADASHELRTPLCSMKGEIEVVLSQERDREEYRKTLIDCAERMEELVRMLNGLLLLARSDGGEKIINRTPLALGELLLNLTEFFDPLICQKRLTLSMNIIDNAYIMGDKTLLHQLFFNLIDNAIKYTPEGGTITVGMTVNPETVGVSVRDTGIGIPEHALPHIFKRFYRIDQSRSRDAGGSGLGLSISHFIVEAHRGRIQVESEVNRGSTFTVYLPRITSH